MSGLSEAIEAKRGLPVNQILEELKAETVDVVGPIEGKDLRDVVTVLCSGLDYRLSQAPDSPLKVALVRAFKSMNISEFGFNLADPLVASMLDAGVDAGLVDVNERLWFYGIATKQVPKYPNIKLSDVLSVIEPDKLDGQWNEIEETSGQSFQLQLNSRPVEATHLVIQWQAGDGEWYHAQAIHGLLAPVQYRAPLPFHGVPRKLRWRCEYALDAAVTVV
jgi:hypothetical protein